jgi:hypothetical protein
LILDGGRAELRAATGIRVDTGLVRAPVDQTAKRRRAAGTSATMFAKRNERQAARGMLAGAEGGYSDTHHWRIERGCVGAREGVHTREELNRGGEVRSPKSSSSSSFSSPPHRAGGSEGRHVLRGCSR